MTRAPDQHERDRAIRARDQTVLIDAGAGTGKTTLLVERIVELVAPSDDGNATTLGRIAAVTFTRRAAGELRLRVRQRLLKLLAKGELSSLRQRRLRDALGAVDTAFLGTIHGFADRLLRLQPMKAKLSPAYAIAEDVEPYVAEAYSLLLHAVQNGTLAAELEGESAEYIAEVQRTFQEAFRAGLLVHSQERDPAPPKVGLDGLVRGFIEHRDRSLEWTGDGAFDAAGFATLADKVARQTDVPLDGLPGAEWLRLLHGKLEELRGERDPVVLFELVRFIEHGVKRKAFRKTKDFTKGSAAQTAWLELTERGFEELLAPLRAAMAARLVRTRPAVVRLYEKVKTRHQILDPIDLLLRLRDLLERDLEVRRFFQGLFDHLLVDEFQDTDPLQAEIILYLTETEPRASRWDEVVVGPGRLTIVGDPKQSIYRFRRADVGMYEQIRQQIARAEHVAVTLSANFRSVPTLIDFGNARLAEVLGTGAAGQIFDERTGRVFHQPLTAAVEAARVPAVHHLPFAFDDERKIKAPEARALEGRALGAYLRWLIEQSGFEVRDPDGGARRKVRYSDVAVLGLVTTKLPILFEALDGSRVPYVMSGGVLFTSDPVHRQFVLALRALADRNDGVAEAALLRPPFFALDLHDLVQHKLDASSPSALRAQAARTWLRETRAARAQRSPGATARALLEDTGFGRAIALGPNGAQRLDLLRELCLHVDLIAASDGLDFDGVTARMRDWIDHPCQLDPPRPVGRDAVQVLSVHQAKGLEFPVVVLWDGMGQWRAYEAEQPWRISRDGRAWALAIDGLKWEEPQGAGILEREKAFADQEKRRLVYVAATRARDLLVIPKGTWEQDARYVHTQLVGAELHEAIWSLPPFVDSCGAPWSNVLGQPDDRIASGPTREARDGPWSEGWTSSGRARQAPAAVTSLAKREHVVRVGEGEVERPPRPARQSRYGPVFGETVHRAIGLVIRRGLTPTEAVQRAALSVGLATHHLDAVRDVERSIVSLLQAKLVGQGRRVWLELAVAAVREERVVSGYIDLVSVATENNDRVVIDFKTDQPPDPTTHDLRSAYPEYIRQLSAYGSVLRAERGALLFTATGHMCWLG